MGKSLRVAVLMGGRSNERDISLKSGVAVVQALGEAGHAPIPIVLNGEQGEELEGISCDVAFLALHGRFGEDGTIQRLLEKRGIPYTGSRPEASGAAMDKIESKRRFRAANLSTPAHRVIRADEPVELLRESAELLGPPVVIKPRAEGSSLGVSIHTSVTSVESGAIDAFRYGPVGLMEKFVPGRELTVGVLDGVDLPITEIRPRRQFFDYQAKYSDDGTQYIVSPSLDDLDRQRIVSAALGAYGALGCEGMARVDLIFDEGRTPWILEVNTIPGFTPRSLVPMAAQAAGIGFPELCSRLVGLALRRPRKLGWTAAML